MNMAEMQERAEALEAELMRHNQERERIENKLTQIGEKSGRTVAARRAKREMERRLAVLNKSCSDIRMDLRHLDV